MLQEAFNNFLDKLVRPEVRLFNRRLFAYQVCGYIGLVLAILLAMTLVVYSDLSLLMMMGVIGMAMLTFLLLAMITKIITGEERIIYFYHQVAVMIMVAISLNILSQPVLVYLDVTILGIGTFLIFGRVGCLMVGCCHGRPFKLGVCYRKEHADAGFTHYFVGVRLFPIQAVESLWVFGVVLVGTVFVLSGRPPGEALAWYVITYDIGRFSFEFARGDPDRPYRWGFSEAQWTSVILMFAVVWAELAGALPFHLWHMGATAGVVLSMFAVALSRRLRQTGRHQLLNPHHVKEVAEAVEQVSSTAAEKPILSRGNAESMAIPMSCTSLGIQMSAGKIKGAEGCIDHYALSSQNGTMTEEVAGTVADLIIRLKHLSNSSKLITGNRGVFHLLVHPLSAGSRK